MALKYLTLLLCFTGFLMPAFRTYAQITQTVYGFLDFTTTIGNTVMVFSPQSAPAIEIHKMENSLENVLHTQPYTSKNETDINPTKHSTYNEKISNTATKKQTKEDADEKNIILPTTSAPDIKPNLEVHTYIEKNKPEYDLLSRQPVEYAEETYRVINLKPDRGSNTNNFKRAHSTKANNLKGINTDITVSKTLRSHSEHSAIETHAQKGGRETGDNHSDNIKPKKSIIHPSSSLRVLKTAAPAPGKLPVSPTRTANRQNVPSNGIRKSQKKELTSNSVVYVDSTTERSSEKRTTKKSRSRNKSKRNKHNNTATPNNSERSNRRSFQSKIQPSVHEDEPSTSVYMFKLNRTPGRWQYKTSPKPRVAIRKQSSDNNNSPTTPSNSSKNLNNFNSNFINDQTDLDSSGSQRGPVLNSVQQEDKPLSAFAETLNIEISTPDDFKQTYYEIATIKSPYIFQAGVVKKTRFITVTSTFEKEIQPEPTALLEEGKPLMENILTFSSKNDALELDSSTITLSPLYLENISETPSLETVTETFTSSIRKLKTQLLPVQYSDVNETTITLVQTYDITTVITATKTLTPLDKDNFIASKNFKDFGGLLEEAGSELNLELEFGDEDNQEDTSEKQSNKNVPVNAIRNPFDLSNPPNPERVNQVASINKFNTPNDISYVITTSEPYIVTETVWESHVVPVINGASTSYRTLSKSVGKLEKTEYHIGTKTVFLPPTPQITPNPYLMNPFQQFQTITTPVVHQTAATITNSKILKLTFGAKTAYTTIYSTDVIPTTLTVLLTTSLPVQPSAAFPAFFPPPYAPYSFIG